MSVLYQIGKITRQMRIERGWTLGVLEQHTGIGRAYLTRIEQGKAKSLLLSHLVALSMGFGLSVKDFLMYEVD